MNGFAQFLVILLAAIGASASAYLGVRFIALRLSERALGAVKKQLSARNLDRTFLGCVIAYCIVFALLSVLRYLSFNTGGFDLGVFDQTVWNSMSGRLFESTFIFDSPNFLGHHFSPILLALVPLYAVWASPISLLILQTLALGGSVYPLYWFAREQIGYLLAFVIGCAYLLSPILQSVNLFEFHEITLAVPLLALAIFFLLRRSYKAMLVCLLVGLAVKEELALIAIAFGAYIFLVHRQRWLGLGLVLSSIALGVLLLEKVIPFFRGAEFGSGYYYFGSGISGGRGLYDYLGHNISEVANTVVTRPDLVFQHLLTPEKLEFLLYLTVPLSFLPLAGIEVSALVLPSLGYLLLSDSSPQFSLGYHYPAPLLPGVFFGATIGLSRTWRALGIREPVGSSIGVELIARRAALAVLVLTSSSLNYVFNAPGPFATHFQPNLFALTSHTSIGDDLMRTIPSDAIVVAQTELASHLSERLRIYEFPSIPDLRQADFLIADQTRYWYGFHQKSWEPALASGYFETIVARDGYLIAKRRSVDQVLNLAFGDRMTLRGYSIVWGNDGPWGRTLRPVLEWQAAHPLAERYRIGVWVMDDQEHVWAQEDREPQDGASPTNQWQVNKPIGDQYDLPLPPTMPPGDYRIVVRVFDPRNKRYLTTPDLGAEATIAKVPIEKNKSSITATDLANHFQLEHPFFYDMGDVRLIGFKPFPNVVYGEKNLPVGLYWRARAKPRGDYLVTVKLIDPAGHVALSQPSRPAAGAYPTTQWDEGEVLLDWHDLEMSALKPGQYTVRVILTDLTGANILGETDLPSVLTVVP